MKLKPQHLEFDWIKSTLRLPVFQIMKFLHILTDLLRISKSFLYICDYSVEVLNVEI